MFWRLNPRLLKSYVKAYGIKVKQQDEIMWLMGRYVQQAVGVAVEHNLAGKKAKSEYFDKPLMQLNKEQKEQENNLTEEEKMKQVEMIFASLAIKKANFDLDKQEKLKGDK